MHVHKTFMQEHGDNKGLSILKDFGLHFSVQHSDNYNFVNNNVKIRRFTSECMFIVIQITLLFQNVY